MNKPIRRVAFVAMIMFALLLANGTYMMIVPAERAGRRAAEPAGPRRRVRPEPGVDPGRRQDRDRQDRADRRRGSSSSGSIPTASCTPRSPATTPTTTAGPRWRTATTPSWPAPTTRCSSAGWSIWSPTGRRRAPACRPPSCRRCSRRRPRRSATRRGRWWRSTRSTGAVLAMVTSPSYDPNEIASHDIDAANKAYNRLAKRRRPSAGQPGGPGDLSARVDLQAGHRGGGAGRRQDAGHQGRVAGPAQAARHQRLPAELHQLRRHARSPSPRRSGCPATPRSPTSVWRWARTSCASRPGSSASTAATCADLGGVASQFPDEMDDAQLALGAIGQFDVAASPLQMAMVSAASPTTAC